MPPVAPIFACSRAAWINSPQAVLSAGGGTVVEQLVAAPVSHHYRLGAIAVVRTLPEPFSTS